jgi:DNA replication and repair protein RecF
VPLSSIYLENYRSYSKDRFELNPGVTLVVGPNASGKTNLLESIYVLATTKSFRAKDSDLVAHNANYFRLVGEQGGSEVAFGYGTSGDKSRVKRVTHDGAHRSLVAHVGTITVVLFEPGDLSLLTGSPDGRRRYLDTILCQTNVEYMSALVQYKRVLKQRNSLLDRFAPEQIRDQIFAWDLKLSSAAAVLVEQRLALIAYLNTLIPELYGKIAGDSPAFELSYMPTADGSDYASAMLQKLDTNLLRDLAIGFTTIGPHREDFEVSFKQSSMSGVASRGEVRTAVLSLKLAEILYMERCSGKRPILLLDDVFSELDSMRRSQLLTQIDGYQTIITTTDADHILVDLPRGYTLVDMENRRG